MLPRKKNGGEKNKHRRVEHMDVHLCVAGTPVLRHRHRLLEEILLKTREEKLQKKTRENLEK